MWYTLSQPWRACLEEAWEAYCAGSVPIGAVVTDGADCVIARGRNRMFEPSARGHQLCGNRMAHAEMNALLALGARDIDPRTCTLYTTTEPCPMCIGAIRMHLVGRVCYASRDPVAGSASFAAATPFMQRCRVEIVGPQHADLESALQAIQAEFLLRRGSQWAGLVESREPACAPAVRLGRRLFESEELAHMRENGVPVGEVLDTLIRQLQSAR